MTKNIKREKAKRVENIYKNYITTWKAWKWLLFCQKLRLNLEYIQSEQANTEKILLFILGGWIACSPVWRFYAVTRHVTSSCKGPISITTLKQAISIIVLNHYHYRFYHHHFLFTSSFIIKISLTIMKMTMIIVISFISLIIIDNH